MLYRLSQCARQTSTRCFHLTASASQTRQTWEDAAEETKKEKEKEEEDDKKITERLSKHFLHEFFDGNSLSIEVRPNQRPGRAWSVEELRLKSNVDLHKLWYVLLKERNMLLTMRGIRERRALTFANPERLDKIKESMENLESVVHERNDAVLRLETGDGASPHMRTVTSFAGFTYQKAAQEHFEPFESTQDKEYETPYLDEDAYITQKLWNEKQEMKRRIEEHDEYLRHEMSPRQRKFKTKTRKTFDRLEQLPTEVVRKAKQAA